MSNKMLKIYNSYKKMTTEPLTDISYQFPTLNQLSSPAND